MTRTCSFDCGIPLCHHSQKTQSQQTHLSLVLRVMAIVLGILAIIAGLFIIGRLSHPSGWALLTLGDLTLIFAASIPCIPNKKKVTKRLDYLDLEESEQALWDASMNDNGKLSSMLLKKIK